MKSVSFLIKPASSSCNLRCSYCFYHDESKERTQANYGIMSEETTQQLITRAIEAVDEKGRVIFSFQGGEPTVAGLDWFRRFVLWVKEVQGNKEVVYALQTNGTLINEEWAKFFYENQFLIGVSLDGYQKNMDAFRFDVNKRGVYFQVLRGIQHLKKAKVEFNILTVVTASLAKNPKALFEFYKSNHFDYVQLIPCLPSLSNDSPMDKEALTPSLYESFFISFFDCWMKEVLNGSTMSVNLFSNLMEMLQGRPPYQCGMIGKCLPQQVVEADGSIYPCDFYAIDAFYLGNLKENSVQECRESKNAQDFINEDTAEKEFCASCPYVKFCHGGCKRQNVCYLEEGYCGYQKVLMTILPKLEWLMRGGRVNG